MYIRTNIHGYRLIKYLKKKKIIKIYIYIYTHPHTHTYIHIHIHICIYTHTYTYIYIYIYIHTHTYYIHTYIFSVYYTFSKITKREVPLQNTLYIKHIHENTL